MSDLDVYLRSRRDRCSQCGWHHPTQGHRPACPAFTRRADQLVEAARQAVAASREPVSEEAAA